MSYAIMEEKEEKKEPEIRSKCECAKCHGEVCKICKHKMHVHTEIGECLYQSCTCPNV